MIDSDWAKKLKEAMGKAIKVVGKHPAKKAPK